MSLRHLMLVTLVLVPSCAVLVPPRAPKPTDPTFVSAGARRTPYLEASSASPSSVNQFKPIAFQAAARDAEGEVLHYTWAVTGGSLNAATGQVVTWTPPNQAGDYVVTLTVTNRRGGAVTALHNAHVKPDGFVTVTEAIIATPPTPMRSAVNDLIKEQVFKN